MPSHCHLPPGSTLKCALREGCEQPRGVMKMSWGLRAHQRGWRLRQVQCGCPLPSSLKSKSVDCPRSLGDCLDKALPLQKRGPKQLAREPPPPLNTPKPPFREEKVTKRMSGATLLPTVANFSPVTSNQSSDLQKNKSIHACCCKPPSWW